jgi:hypothetical protein
MTMHVVRKLTGFKINLYNQSSIRENIHLLAVNMNSPSTTQIRMNSCKTIHLT